MPSRKQSQTADPSKTPIHTCWQECECEGCKKIRRDKTPKKREVERLGGLEDSSAGFSATHGTGITTAQPDKTPPASKKNWMDYGKEPISPQGIFELGLIEGRREVLSEVEKAFGYHYADGKLFKIGEIGAESWKEFKRGEVE